MSFAMEKSGAALLLANTITQYVSDPYAILAIACIITGLITNVMSNTATTATEGNVTTLLINNIGNYPKDANTPQSPSKNGSQSPAGR